MIRLSKNFKTFEEILSELKNVGYEDEIFDFFNEDSSSYSIATYDDLLSDLIIAVSEDKPGLSNIKYPNCMSFNVNAYGFSYTKNNIGFGVTTKFNRKTGDITYTLSFLFNKPQNLLKNNPVFNTIMQMDEYELTETGKFAKK